MRTHTYWITYEEYLACGGIPRKPTYEIAPPRISYRRAPRMGARRITMTVNENKHLHSECCGCVVSGGKKTRRKMKKRKPRKSRKARKSARG